MERHVLLRHRAAVVQPRGSARPPLRRALHARPGTVAGQRDPVPEEKQPHADAVLPSHLAVEAHIEVEDALRDGAGHRLHREGLHETPQQDVELFREGDVRDVVFGVVVPGRLCRGHFDEFVRVPDGGFLDAGVDDGRPGDERASVRPGQP